MDINSLLREKECECGRKHSCSIEKIYIEADAMRHLTEMTQEYSRILIAADENTYHAAGDRTMNYLKGKDVKKVIFSGASILVPDENAVEKVMDSMEGIELIIGIGSGVIQDLCKYVSHNTQIPYYIVATAPSMDGYASNGAAMLMGGMKITYPAGLPKAILADTEVIKDAPFEMIQAGYGDIIGKYSALNDWKLSHLVNGEYFCDYIYDLVLDMVKQTQALSEGLKQRDPDSVKTLMEALAVVGIAMSYAGNSRPASGSEHHMAHFFEVTGILENKKYYPHGIDVAYSTVITVWLREMLKKSAFSVKQHIPDAEYYNTKMLKIYGRAAKGCMDLQEKAGSYRKNRIPEYVNNEEEIKALFSEGPTKEDIIAMLDNIGLKMDAFFELYGKEKIKDAISYSKDLKDRYSVLWTYYDIMGEEIPPLEEAVVQDLRTGSH